MRPGAGAPAAETDAVRARSRGRSATRTRADWQRRHLWTLLAIDITAAAAAAGLAVALERSSLTSEAELVAAAMPAAWIALVAANGAYRLSVVGSNRDSSARIFASFLELTALTTFGGYAALTGTTVVTLLALLGLNIAARAVAQHRLDRRRADGRASRDVIVVGRTPDLAEFAEQARSDPRAGVRVVATWPTDAALPGRGAVRALGAAGPEPAPPAESAAQTAAERTADAVVVLPGAMSPPAMRRLAWRLEGTGVALRLSSGLSEVTPGRLRVEGTERQPLFRVELPRFTGPRRVVKACFDRVAATLALVLLSPVLIATALAVKVTSAGPVLFRQKRVGVGGRQFTMLKFRSMIDGADGQRDRLAEANEHPDGPLFKICDDPRLTRVGRAIRRYSLDELPQLLNVVKGDMSLVGPRPPLPCEVEQYPDHVHRRLLVKPGLTGLWQVSGRSDLSWEEAVRLDLSYVENWSLVLDLVLLWRTVRAVVRPRGAY